MVSYTDESRANHTATGFVLNSASAASLVEAVALALEVYAQKETWRQLQLNAMQQDFSWQASSQEYLRLYQQAVLDTE